MESIVECKHGFEVDDRQVDFEGEEPEAHYIPVDMNLEGSKHLAVEQGNSAKQVEQAAKRVILADYKQIERAVEMMEI